MIAAKGAVGRYMERGLIPAMYLAQELPSVEVKERILAAVKKTGIPAELEDFESPARITALLAALDSLRKAEPMPLFNEL